MIKYLLAGSLFLISLVSSAQITKDTTVAVKDTVKAVPAPVLKKLAYQINIPAKWKIKEGCIETDCSLLSQADTLSATFDKFTENINIVYQPLPSKNYTVEQYVEYSRKYLPSVVKGFKVHKKKKIKPNAWMMVYSGEKSGYFQTWRQYYYVKNAKVYIVTFAAETPKYEYFLPFVTESLSSFKLL